MKDISQITILMVLYEESEEIVIKTLKKIKNFKIIIVDNTGDQNLKKSLINLKYQLTI